METENINSKYIEYCDDRHSSSIHGISIRGRAHQSSNQPNQDAYKLKIAADCSYMIVGDGLGSCSKSHIGAKAAVEAMGEWIDEKLLFDIDFQSSFNQLGYEEIIDGWKEKIDLFDVHSYDTTLLYAIVFPEVLYVGGIGDGLMMYKVNNEVTVASTRQIGFGNMTQSLGMKQASNYINTQRIPLQGGTQVHSIILATDGVADDLDPNTLQEFINYLDLEWRAKGSDGLQTMLLEWLENWETNYHSDDRTFCLFQYRKR